MKNTFTKAVSILVVCLFLLTLTVGCGSTNNSGSDATKQAGSSASNTADNGSGGVKKLVGMVWGSSEVHQNLDKGLREVFPEFNNKATVEWVIGGPGDGDVAQKIRLGLSANDSPCDFVMLNYTQVPEFAEAGVLLDLSDTVDQYASDLLSGGLALTKYKDKTIAFPYAINAKLWFYRKDMFDAAGIDPAQVKNLDDFIAAGKKLQGKYPKSYMWQLGQSNPMYNYMMVLSGTDARFADDKGNFLLEQDPNFRKTLEAMKRMVDEKVVANISEWTPDWEKAFSDSTIASDLCATWLAVPIFLPKYAGDSQAGKWAVTQWPSFIGESGGSEAGGAVMVIPKFSKEPELCKEYLSKMFLTKEGSMMFHKTTNYFPAVKSAAMDPIVQSPNAFFGQSLPVETMKAIENFKIFKWDPAAQQELNIVQPYFDKAINGQISIDDALKGATNDLKNQIGNPYERQ